MTHPPTDSAEETRSPAAPRDAESWHAPASGNGEPPRLAETIEADTEAPPRQVIARGGTFESFRHRNFTLFWLGALTSNIGSWMQQYALGIVVFGFRGSSFDLGLVQFLSGIPVLFLALPAGDFADRVDRRRLLIWIQVVLMVQALALGVLYNSGFLGRSHPTASLAWVAGLGLLSGVMLAYMAPAFQSMLPDLVPRELLMNGIALNSAQFQSSRLVGPLVAASLVLLGAGMGEIFYVNAASFLFVIWALWAIRPEKLVHAQPRAHQGAAKREPARRRLTAGLRYARENRAVRFLLASVALMTICGFPYMVLLPAIVGNSLGVPEGRELERLVAFVMAANGAGALVGSLAVASLRPTVNRNRIIPATLAAFATVLIGFGLSRSLWLMVALSVLAGAGFLATVSLANTSIQAEAPGHLRGRVMALFVLAFMGMMPISGLVFGPLGDLTGPGIAVVIGAVPLLAWAILLMARPALLQPDAAPPSP